MIYGMISQNDDKRKVCPPIGVVMADNFPLITQLAIKITQ